MPTAIILQFVSTFSVWLLADGFGLSGVLTMVCYAITVARASPLHDDDPVSRELSAAREGALRAALASLARERSPVAELVRQELRARLAYEPSDAHGGDAVRSEHSNLLHGALQAARQAVLAMRGTSEIGDDAFHRMEEELDWLEMADGSARE